MLSMCAVRLQLDRVLDERPDYLRTEAPVDKDKVTGTVKEEDNAYEE